MGKTKEEKNEEICLWCSSVLEKEEKKWICKCGNVLCDDCIDDHIENNEIDIIDMVLDFKERYCRMVND